MCTHLSQAGLAWRRSRAARGEPEPGRVAGCLARRRGWPGRRDSGRDVHPGYIGGAHPGFCRSGPGTVVRGGPAKVLGGPPGCGGLGGMALGRAQVRDGGGQHRQSVSQVACAAGANRRADCGKPAADEPQLVTGVRAPRDPAVRRAGGLVVGVRGLVKRWIPEHPGRNAQNIRRPGLARRLFIRRVPLCSSDPVLRVQFLGPGLAGRLPGFRRGRWRSRRRARELV